MYEIQECQLTYNAFTYARVCYNFIRFLVSLIQYVHTPYPSVGLMVET